jgi:uncharacterized membrane protein
MPSLTAALASIRPVHRFLAGRSFYALALASALACTLLALRVARLHQWGLAWLTWNLILAWVPYLASLWADRLRLRRGRQPWLLALPGLLWLLFLPNAPYIMTDFMHLRTRPDLPWLFWYDVVTIATLAWTGCVLGAVSLGIMQGIVAQYLGRAMSWLFVLVTAGLCGVGIYLGRFEHWNSWDVLVSPRARIAEMTPPLLNPSAYLRPWAMCALFAAFFLVSYLTLGARWGAARAEERA